MRWRGLAPLLVALLAALRLAHVNLLWSDEDYHLAASLQVLHGRVPYRDFWYDKPPLGALFYSLIGGYAGWPLRLLDCAFVLLCCWFAYRLARGWWGEAEGRWAALLLAFYLAFYLPSATIPFAVDGLLLLPHLAAVCMAREGRPFASGVWCAVGLLTNVKAVFVAATCAVWLISSLPWFAAGLVLPLGIAAGVGALLGALPDFYLQVWRWGLIYAGGASVPHALVTGLKRCADWLAFHAALVAGLVLSFRESRFRLGVWLLLGCVALLLGNHFAPRYFFQVLPVLVIAGARGVVVGLSRYGRLARVVLALLLVVPMVRFGPRYVTLLGDNLAGRQTNWADAAMDVDSQQAARVINALKQPGNTLFVWGYRPDDYVYTRLVPAGKFWDSQPLDGVPADRHLESGEGILNGAAQANRVLATRDRPTFFVDGLGLLNPGLAPERFPEIRSWLGDYQLVSQTELSRIYRRR